MSTTHKTRVWNEPPLSWLFSVKFGLILLAVITLASIAGTLIEDLKRAQALVYYSFWYRALLLLLATNVACATYRTIMEKIRSARQIYFQDDRRFYDGLTPSASLPCGEPVDAVAAAFRQQGFHTQIEGDKGYARKGMFGRWGAPISHIGFIVVLLGGFASAWTSREGVVRVGEGETTDTMVAWTPQPQEKPLGFLIHVEDYTMDFFPNTRPPMPSSYISTVSIFSLKGEHQVTQPVEVNRSLKTHGWTLHQTSYEENPQGERLLVELATDTSGGRSIREVDDPSIEIASDDAATTLTLEMTPGQTRMIPDITREGETASFALSSERPRRWTLVSKGQHYHGRLAGETDVAGNLVLRAERFEPDWVMGADRRITSRSQNMNNPAVMVSILEEGQIIAHPWLFAREDLKKMMHQETGPLEIDLVQITGTAPHYEFVVSVRPVGSTETPAQVTLRLGESLPLAGPESAPATQAVEEDVTAAGPWRVQQVKRVPAYYTSLTLTRNAAIPLIYTGCAIMMLGLLVAFGISKREVWFSLDPQSSTLRVAAIYRHPQDEFDRSTQKVLDRLATTNTGRM